MWHGPLLPLPACGERVGVGGRGRRPKTTGHAWGHAPSLSLDLSPQAGIGKAVPPAIALPGNWSDNHHPL
jgi:hypothetical protein